MIKKINVSDELKLLSKKLLETIEEEDKEYEFKTKGYHKEYISVLKFKEKLEKRRR